MESPRVLQAGPPAAPAVHPGRPRSTTADEAIITATAALLVEVGYRALCMETVAARAGVSKATLYRRHKDKQALVASMVIATSGTPPREHGTPPGNTRQGLEFMLRMASLAMSNPSWGPILGAMLSEGHRDGGLVDVMRSQIFEPSGEIVRKLVENGLARGELAPGTTSEIVNDLLFGALLCRSVIGGPMDDEWRQRVIAGVWSGIGAGAGEPSAETTTDRSAGSPAPSADRSWA
jgi:AcrR family transcriptional regulator